MEDSKKTETVTVAVSPELKAQIKSVAKAKHWKVSQALGIFLDEYWPQWLEQLGVSGEEQATPPKEKSKLN